jgi:hypothetical protein
MDTYNLSQIRSEPMGIKDPLDGEMPCSKNWFDAGADKENPYNLRMATHISNTSANIIFY